MFVAVVLLPLAAVVLSLRQPAQYRASAKVLLKQANLAATLSGIEDSSVFLDPNRLAQTQIQLAETPGVAARVLRAAGVRDRSPNALLGSLSISAEPNADILDFSVTDRDPALAERLTNVYARQYTIFRKQLDTSSLEQALNDVLRRIDQLQAAGGGSALYVRSLTSKAEQLRTLLALENSNAVVARVADGAAKVQPRPIRDGFVGLALGIVLGIGLAFLWDALDTRVRSAEEIAERLGLTLLGRLPEPPRRLQRKNSLVMLDEPTSVQAEAFRMLRTNLDFVNLDRDARSIMITSALEEEGKSTTVANLAVAAARAGRRVVLVDLDLRRAYLDRFFQLDGRPGLTDVALGHAELHEAMVRVAIPDVGGSGSSSQGNGRVPLEDPLDRDLANLALRKEGSLDVLPSGPLPPDAGEFVGTGAVSSLLKQLCYHYDLVLIDAPPLLHVGDALMLAAQVDALVLLTSLHVVRRPVLKELQRVLETCPAEKIGFVLAGAHLEEGYGYGGYYYSQQRSRSRRTKEPAA